MATVKVIPPRVVGPKALRIAAYCRVSSDSADQLHSYAVQIKSYTDFIQQHTDWTLVDIYADEGLTGTRMDKREDFQRMMADCHRGKIDRILVKSISRFARNTKDCLSALRELSSLGVTVLFEEDHIDTKTLTSELMVSVFGSLAQQESVSISQNMRMSYQRRMERGEYITSCAPFGFKLVHKKDLEICTEQSKIVSRIFQRYSSGDSMERIAEALTLKGIPSPNGLQRWHTTQIRRILNNEKYIGDTLCQKTYSENVFPFKSHENHGQRQQYYVEGSHSAIVSNASFENVQRLRKARAPQKQGSRGGHPLSKMIYCGNCGTMFVRRVSAKGYVVWVCREHDEKAERCPMKRIPESAVYQAFTQMCNKLWKHQTELLGTAIVRLEELRDKLAMDNPSVLMINQEIAAIAEQSHRVTLLQSRGIIGPELRIEKQRSLDERLAALRKERRMLISHEEIEDKIDSLQNLQELLRDIKCPITEFDSGLFMALVEKIIAESHTRLRFCLHGSIELVEPC